MNTRSVFGLTATVLAVLILVFNVFADHRDLCTLDVSYERSDGGGYVVNPREGYDLMEIYHIYAVHEYPEADSIVAWFETQSQEYPDEEEGTGWEGTIPNQTLSFTVHDNWSFYDYYVLHVERLGLESSDHYYRAFAPGETVLIQDSNTFDFYFDGASPNYWVGDFGRYCTPYMEDWGDGPQAYGMDFNWGTCDPELNAGPLLDVHLLGPESMCVLWDDSSETNESYKLEVIRWQESEDTWGDTTRYTLPGDYSGYCVNELQPDMYYSFQLYPVDENGQEGEKRLCIHKTIPTSDIESTDLFHFLPYAPITGSAAGGSLSAYTFLYGWGDDDGNITLYHYLLIKRQDGRFSVYTLHRGDSFSVTDIEIVDNKVYVSHTGGDLIKLTLESDQTLIQQMGYDFGNGYPKQLECLGDSMYIANKLKPGAVGLVNPLGVVDLGSETLTLLSHPDLVMGSDLIAIGPAQMVWLANNIPWNDGYQSTVAAFDLNKAPAFQPESALDFLQSKNGIIDFKVNPVTGELVYLSPVYGFCGHFGTNYNRVLDLPGGMANEDVGSFVFDSSGQLVIKSKEGISTFYSSSSYDAIVSNAPLNWQEYQIQPETLLSGLAPMTLLLPNPPPAQWVVGGLLLVGTIIQVSQSIAMSSQQVEPFHLGVAEAPVAPEAVIDDVDDYRDELTGMGANRMLYDPGEEPDYDDLFDKLSKILDYIDLAKAILEVIESESQPDPDDECAITDPAFTNEYYTWDEYYPLVTSGSPPFEHGMTANCECVGAVFSKFIFVDRIDGDQPQKRLYISEPIQSEDVGGIDFEPIEQLIASLDDCYDPGFIMSGLISYGPWKRIDTNGADQSNYFMMTDRSFGPELYAKNGEYTSIVLFDVIQNWIATKPDLSLDQFYLSTDLTHQIHHPNFPAPSGVFTDQIKQLKPMLPSFWEFDRNGRTTFDSYLKDPDERVPFKVVFEAGTDKLIVESTRQIVGNSISRPTLVMACNGNLYMNHDKLGMGFFATINAHSQVLGGGAVLTAGEITCREGEPWSINNISGHYRPSVESLDPLLALFNSHGYYEMTRRYEDNGNIVHIIFEDGLANTSSSINAQHIDDSGISSLGVAASLYDDNQSDYASSVKLFFGDTEYTATEIGTESEPTFLFTLPFSDLQQYRGFYLQGLCGADTLKELVHYSMANPAESENDTLGRYPHYVHWIPSPENSTLDQSVWMSTVHGETLDEPPVGQRFNFLVSIVAEQQVNGTLCFRFVHQDTYSGDETSIVHKTIGGEWSPIPTQLDSSGEYFEATIDENGLYAMVTTGSPTSSPSPFSVRAFLQGPYQSETSEMCTFLAHANRLPYQSPFDESSIPFEGVPDSLVDWMVLELLPEVDAEPAWQTSVLVSETGWLCTPEGETTFEPGVEGESYYIRLRHRNHLPTVSATKMTLSPSVHSVYRFSSTGTRFHPSTPGQFLETDCWGLTAGDMNQDGHLTTEDYVIWYNQKDISTEGGLLYLQGDLNLDGNVDEQDFQLWQQNSRNQGVANDGQ